MLLLEPESLPFDLLRKRFRQGESSKVFFIPPKIAAPSNFRTISLSLSRQNTPSLSKANVPKISVVGKFETAIDSGKFLTNYHHYATVACSIALFEDRSVKRRKAKVSVHDGEMKETLRKWKRAAVFGEVICIDSF